MIALRRMGGWLLPFWQGGHGEHRSRLPRTLLGGLDPWLTGATVILACGGLVMIFSVTAATSARPTAHLESQGLKVLMGFGLFALAYKMDYHRLVKLAPWLFLLGVASLFLVYVPGLGHEVNGARRWIRIGSQTVQPADVARMGLILHLAYLLSKPPARLTRFGTGLAPCLVALALVAVPVAKQPNLSTVLALLLITGLMLLAGGIPWRHLALVVGAVGGTIPFVLHSYQLGRLTDFLRFWREGGGHLEGNYQLHQSLIAIGSGGLVGQGLGESRQKWSFLPDAHTDFIFAILGEEFGFAGAMVVIGLIGVIIWRAFEAARRAPDPFGSLLAAGIGSSVAVYAGINMAVATGLIPTTGLPLPLFSYGGTAVLVTLFSLGIVANIASQGDRPPGRKV